MEILLQRCVHVGTCSVIFVGHRWGKKVVKKTTLCLLKYCWEKEGKKEKETFLHYQPCETCEDSPMLQFLSTVGSQSVFPGLWGEKLADVFFFFASFSPSKTATGINSIAAAEGKTPAAFNHKLGSVHTFF